MSVTTTLLNVNKVGRVWKRQLHLDFSGSYSGSGTVGQIIDLTAVVNTPKLERAIPAKVPKNLGSVRVMNHPPGYVAVLDLDTSNDLTDCLSVRLFVGGAGATDPLDEVADGAYAAGLTDGQGMTIEIDEVN